MNEEKETNLENNTNVDAQPVDLNPVEGENEAIEMPTPVVNTDEAPIEGPAPVESEETIASPNLQEASMSNLEPVNEENGIPDVTPTSDAVNPEEIAQGIQNGDLVNAVSDPNEMIGSKVGSSADEPKKKGKKKTGLIIAIVIILAIIGGFAYFAYTYEYKTADKTIDSLFNGLNNTVRPYLRDGEKRIGDYDVDASFTYNTSKGQIHLNGNYAYNLEDYIYFETSVDKLYLDQDYLDKTPIKASVYVNDDKVYFKLDEILEKYIYAEVPGLSEQVFDVVKQNDINYEVIYNGFINAYSSSIKKYTLSQEIADVTIDGKSTKANVVNVRITKNNIKPLTENFIRLLANNDAFMTEIAKFTESSKDELKKDLEDYIEDELKSDFDEFDQDITIKIYSNIVSKKFLGSDFIVKDSSNTYTVKITPINDTDKKIVFYQDSDKKFETTIGYKLTNTASKTSQTFTLKGEYNYNDDVISYDFKFTNNINIPYQEDKPVVRDSVSYENLTSEDVLTAINNIQDKYGLLGTIIYSYLTNSLGGSTPETPDYEY